MEVGWIIIISGAFAKGGSSVMGSQGGSAMILSQGVTVWEGFVVIAGWWRIIRGGWLCGFKPE
jgi:hypothetical protein